MVLRHDSIPAAQIMSESILKQCAATAYICATYSDLILNKTFVPGEWLSPVYKRCHCPLLANHRSYCRCSLLRMHHNLLLVSQHSPCNAHVHAGWLCVHTKWCAIACHSPPAHSRWFKSLPDRLLHSEPLNNALGASWNSNIVCQLLSGAGCCASALRTPASLETPVITSVSCCVPV